MLLQNTLFLICNTVKLKFTLFINKLKKNKKWGLQNEKINELVKE
jgi:hypothetical protein